MFRFATEHRKTAISAVFDTPILCSSLIRLCEGWNGVEDASVSTYETIAGLVVFVRVGAVVAPKALFLCAICEAYTPRFSSVSLLDEERGSSSSRRRPPTKINRHSAVHEAQLFPCVLRHLSCHSLRCAPLSCEVRAGRILP